MESQGMSIAMDTILIPLQKPLICDSVLPIEANGVSTWYRQGCLEYVE